MPNEDNTAVLVDRVQDVIRAELGDSRHQETAKRPLRQVSFALKTVGTSLLLSFWSLLVQEWVVAVLQDVVRPNDQPQPQTLLFEHPRLHQFCFS